MLAQGVKQAFALALLACGLILLTWSSLFTPPINKSAKLQCVDGSQSARIAVLVYPPINNPPKNKIAYRDVVTKFLNATRRFFINTTVNPIMNAPRNRCSYIDVNYFIFYNQQDGQPIEKISRVTLVPVPSRLLVVSAIVFQPTNPCQYFLETASKFGFFDSENFDYVLAVDASVKFMGRVNVGTVFTSQRFAVMHQTFQNVKKPKLFVSPKYNKEDVIRYNRTMLNLTVTHYSSKMFGGSTSVVKDTCQQITEGFINSFHQTLNEHLRDYPPNVALYPNGQDNVETLESVDVMNLKQQLQMPPFEYVESDYARLLGYEADEIQATIYQEAAERLANAIRRNYIGEIQKMYRRALKNRKRLPQPPTNDSFDAGGEILLRNFMAASCPMNRTCGGFGDRLRGMVVAFYLAIATGRVFDVRIVKPINLASYFEVNDRLYNVPAWFYEAQRNLSLSNFKLLLQMGVDSAVVDFFNSNYFEILLSNYTNLEIISNRYTGLTSAFRNKKYSLVVDPIAEYEIASSDYGHFDYPIFISAAFRVVLNRMTRRLKDLHDSVIASTIGFQIWNRSVKIGVQLRTEVLSEFKLDVGSRVRPLHIACFIQEIKRVIHEKARRLRKFRQQPQIVVFATTDWPEIIPILRSNFSSMENVTFFYTGQEQNLTLAHVDQSNEAADDPDGWQKMAKTYLDWYLLTKMDFLVITRSGLGETASMMSLKPTVRFFHWEQVKHCPFYDYNAFMPSVLTFGPNLVHALK